MMNTQNDSEDSSSNETTQEVAKLFLMAYKEEVTSKTKIDFVFDELQDIFYDLLDEFKKIKFKNKELKRYNHIQIKQKEECLKKKFLYFQKIKI